MNISSFDMSIQEFYPIYNVMVWYLVTDEANDDFVRLVEVYLNLQYFPSWWLLTRPNHILTWITICGCI